MTLDRRRPLPPQICAGVRAAIQSGRLKPDDRVPATRRFARALGVSRQVIVAAYEELASSGHVRGRVGDGSYVARARRQRAAPGFMLGIVDPDGYSIRCSRLE